MTGVYHYQESALHSVPALVLSDSMDLVLGGFALAMLGKHYFKSCAFLQFGKHF